MINFFRKIRQNLIMKNQTAKYFKYAIGEIILVVIGILIALQINNWNEARKLNIKESIYLNGLKSDFQQSSLELDRVIKKTSRVAKIADTLVSMIKLNGNEISSHELDSLAGGSTGFTVFMTSEGVIQDIIGSGKLDMIKNTELRNKIASWGADLSMIREHEKLSKESSSKFSDHSNQYFDIVNAKFGKDAFIDHKRSEFLNDNILTNHLASIWGNSLQLNELYLKKSVEIDSLIMIIDNELE